MIIEKHLLKQNNYIFNNYLTNTKTYNTLSKIKNLEFIYYLMEYKIIKILHYKEKDN